jgi:SnoaL-like domain
MPSPIDVTTAFLRAFTSNDPDAIADMVAEGFRNEHHSALGSDCVGRDEYRRRLPHFLESFSDRHYQIDDLVEYRRDAVTDVVIRYRFVASYGELPIEIPGVMWFTVRGPLITRRVDTWDSLTFLQQTGQWSPDTIDPSATT